MTHSGRTPPYSPGKMGHLARAWCCNGGDVLLASSKTQPAPLDMLPPCDVGISTDWCESLGTGQSCLPGARPKMCL